jgi:hypothetical protein
MPSEDKGSDGEKHTGFSEIVKNIDGNAKAIGLIKRFFNQVLGIYVPALIFIIYIWIIMQESGRQYIFGYIIGGSYQCLYIKNINPVASKINLETKAALYNYR